MVDKSRKKRDEDRARRRASRLSVAIKNPSLVPVASVQVAELSSDAHSTKSGDDCVADSRASPGSLGDDAPSVSGQDVEMGMIDCVVDPKASPRFAGNDAPSDIMDVEIENQPEVTLSGSIRIDQPDLNNVETDHFNQSEVNTIGNGQPDYELRAQLNESASNANLSSATDSKFDFSMISVRSGKTKKKLSGAAKQSANRKALNITSSEQSYGIDSENELIELTNSQLIMPPPRLPFKRDASACSSASSASVIVTPARKRGRPTKKRVIEESSNASEFSDDALLMLSDCSVENFVRERRNLANAGIAPQIVPNDMQPNLQYNLFGFENLSTAIEMRHMNFGLENYYQAIRHGVEMLKNSRNLWMDMDTVIGYLMYVSYLSNRRIAIVNTTYSTNATQAPNARDSAWGDVLNYDILIIPYLVSATHFVVTIHERNGETIFYDSLAWRQPQSSRLYNVHGLQERIQSAIVDFEPNLIRENINIQIAPHGSFNDQMDGTHCGVHIALIVESYLMNGSALLNPNDFNIGVERVRILDQLSELTNYRNPVYERRPFSLDDVVVNGNRDELSFSEIESDILNDTDFDLGINNTNGEEIGEVLSQLSQMSVAEADLLETASNGSSTSSRRSNRNIPRVDYRQNIPRIPSNSNLTSINYCKSHQRHPGLGCFSKSGKHFVERFDCGDLGDKICKFCGALLFNKENSQMCCADGKVKLPEIEQPFELAALLQDPRYEKHYYDSARYYNNILRFGTLECGRKRPPGDGRGYGPVILMNGDIQHRVQSVFVKPGEEPTFGQFFLLNSDQAEAAVRGQYLFQKGNLNVELFKQLHAIIQKYHALARQFISLKGQYDIKLLEAIANGLNDVPVATLVFLHPRDVAAAMRDPTLHPRQVNLPSGEDFCAIHVTNDTNDQIAFRGTRLLKIAGGYTVLQPFEPMCDPAHYVLSHPHGEPGFYFGIPLVGVENNNVVIEEIEDESENEEFMNSNEEEDNSDEEEESEIDDELLERDDETENNFIMQSQEPQAKKLRDQVSIRQHARYRLAIRKSDGGKLANKHFLYPHGSVPQEYILEQSFKAQRYHYDYLQKHDARLRAATSEEVRAYLEKDLLAKGLQLGKVFRLNADVPLSVAWFQQKLQDAMTMFSTVQEPTFMLTLTSNFKWPEIVRNMPKLHIVENRVDIASRVFALRHENIMHLIMKKNVLGKVVTGSVSTEFQKRGGVHTHSLFGIKGAEKTPEFVDEYISARIPELPPANDKSKKANMIRVLREKVFEIPNTLL